MIRTLCYYLYLCKYQLNSVKFKSCVMFLEGRVLKKGVWGRLKISSRGGDAYLRGRLFKKISSRRGAYSRGALIQEGGAYSRKYGR